MGSWPGHVLPGTLFLLFGLIWAIKASYRYFALGVSQKRRCGRFRWDMIETALMLFLASFGTIIEQMLPWEPKFHVVDSESGEFTRANNWSHSTMYAFFMLQCISSILVMKMPKLMPHCLHHMTMALAFGVEGFLFYFHTHGREELDVRVHVLLLFAIWSTSILYIILCFIDKNEYMATSYILRPTIEKILTSKRNQTDDSTSLLQNGDATDHEVVSVDLTDGAENIPLDEYSHLWGDEKSFNEGYHMNLEHQKAVSEYKKIFTIQLCIASSTLLHGMWFWETAYILYPPHGQPWDQDSHENIAFLTMFFTWYIILAIITVGAIFTFFGLISRRKAAF